MLKKSREKKNTIFGWLFCIAAAIYLMGFWVIRIVPERGMQEMIVSSGEKSFTADFSAITSVIPCNNDISLAELLDNRPISLILRIRDKSGALVAEISEAGCYIHTNSYISTDQFLVEGVPFELESGELYSLEYEAFCGDAALTDLSFSFGGEYYRPWKITGAVLLLSLLAVLISLSVYRVSDNKSNEEGVLAENAVGVHSSKRLFWYAIILWIAVSGLFLIPAPETTGKENERTAFANAYAFSSRIMNKPVTDVNGYVYIEEEGIRNMGNLSYMIPLSRFWNNAGYGNTRTVEKTSTLFQTDRKKADLLTLVDGLAIAGARSMDLRYQIVYLSGMLTNSLLMLLVFLRCLQLVFSNAHSVTGTAGNLHSVICLLVIVFLLPSVIQSEWSYQGNGIRIALGIVYALMCIGREGNYFEHILLSVLLLLLAPLYLIFAFCAGISLSSGRNSKGVVGIIMGVAGIMLELARLLRYNIADSLAAIFNTLTIGGDNLFTGIVCGSYYGSSYIRADFYVLAAIVLFVWGEYQYSLYQSGGKYNCMMAILLMIGDFLAFTRGEITASSGACLGMMTGISGASFLPFAFAPLFYPGDTRTGVRIRTGSPVFMIVIFMAAIVGMKCIS